jgi:DNA-binding MarR family transcriptional regulator
VLRAYLDAVTLSEALQTYIWHSAELTLAQVRVMRRLARNPQTLSQLVDRLETRRLITRERDETDRRKVVAALTEEGRRLVSAIPFLEGTAIRMAVERMTETQRVRIGSALDEFNAAVKQAEDELVGAAVDS